MGSGSSARPKGEAKYKTAPKVDDHDPPPRAQEDNNDIRKCDQCGETRKTFRIGDEDAKFLCLACQMASGSTPQPRWQKRQMTGELAAPQPLLNTEAASASLAAKPRLRRVRSRTERLEGGIAALEASDEEDTRKRRGAKDRCAPTNAAQIRGHMSEGGALGQPRLRKAKSMTETGILSSDGGDHLLGAGLADLADDLEHAQLASVVPKSPTEQEGKVELGAGFNLGDKVVSLISRVRGGLMVLELGHEGVVMGKSGGGSTGEEFRLLVQFMRGYDWLLPPYQICPASTLPEAKAAGLPGYNWGTRVRSLVTYLKPDPARRDLALGDEGTVIGPGASPGKLAVRFDGSGEWNIWPKVICRTEDWNAAVQERLANGLCRGERVVPSAQVTGRRSGGRAASEVHTLGGADEGTVVGPGHKEGCLLVHFDADDRVWSLAADWLQRCW